MHDFIQSLSFQALNPPALARTQVDVLRGVMRSFNAEVPFTACRPVPAKPARRLRRPANRKS